MLINKIVNFLEIIQSNGEYFFIEAEAKQKRMDSFLDDYNSRYTPHVSADSDGIIILQEDANKWGLELRLYVSSCPPEDILENFTKNDKYRENYKYRLNSNEILTQLFELGFRIGIN